MSAFIPSKGDLFYVTQHLSAPSDHAAAGWGDRLMVSSPTPKTGPMCVVNIGFACELLMPADKGMKLVALLQESLLVKLDYQSRGPSLYVAGDVPEVNYTSVKADQVVMPQATTTTPPRRKGPLLLEGN